MSCPTPVCCGAAGRKPATEKLHLVWIVSATGTNSSGGKTTWKPTGLPDTLEETVARLGDVPVYLTVDLDVLDPSVFPGTGTPEPGGVSFDELRRAVTLVCSRAHVVGCDVNELSPPYDPSGISTAAACKIVREMLLALPQSRG